MRLVAYLLQNVLEGLDQTGQLVVALVVDQLILLAVGSLGDADKRYGKLSPFQLAPYGVQLADAAVDEGQIRLGPGVWFKVLGFGGFGGWRCR